MDAAPPMANPEFAGLRNPKNYKRKTGIKLDGNGAAGTAVSATLRE